MKSKRIIDFYLICYRLKNLIRTGWLDWHLNKDRVESVAEHIYGTQMLAISMYSEFNYDIDLEKVIMMLAVHELEETIIGDLVFFDVTKEEKTKMGHDAVEKILKDLLKGEEIKQYILEFDEGKTKEAKFAYNCDKLECDIMCKLYDDEGFFPLESIEQATHISNPKVKEIIKNGEATLSDLWISNDLNVIDYDDNFREVAKYIKNNHITDNLQEK